MSKLARYSLSHDEKKKRWVLKHEGTGQTVKTFGTKAAATKGGVLERAVKGTGSVVSENAMVKSKKSAPFRAAPIRANLRVRWRPAEGYASRVAGAGGQVVVDHAGRLHEGVDDRRPAEFELLRLEFL